MLPSDGIPQPPQCNGRGKRSHERSWGCTRWTSKMRVQLVLSYVVIHRRGFQHGAREGATLSVAAGPAAAPATRCRFSTGYNSVTFVTASWWWVILPWAAVVSMFILFHPEKPRQPLHQRPVRVEGLGCGAAVPRRLFGDDVKDRWELNRNMEYVAGA
jgi:hypothetical protein